MGTLGSTLSTADIASRKKLRAAAEGFTVETGDRRSANSSQLLVSGTVYAELIELVAGDSLPSLSVFVVTGGASLTIAKVGIYSGTSRVAISADNKANFTSSGVIVTTDLLSAPYVPSTSGGYYLACLFTGTTPPTLQAWNNTAAALGLAIGSGSRPCAIMTGQTDLPTTATWAATNTKPLWMSA